MGGQLLNLLFRCLKERGYLLPTVFVLAALDLRFTVGLKLANQLQYRPGCLFLVLLELRSQILQFLMLFLEVLVWESCIRSMFTRNVPGPVGSTAR